MLFALGVVWLAAWTTGILSSATAHAQQPAPSDTLWQAPPDSARKNAVQLWGGYSPGSMRLFGTIEGARLSAVGVRYLRRIRQHADVRHLLEYTVDVLPLVWMNHAPVRGAPEMARRRGVRTLRGVGLTPVGLRLSGPLDQRWQLYFDGGLGFVYFADPLPDRRGKELNFTARAGLGIRLRAGPYTALTLGYRFHHLSNGFRGRINPGFDSNFFHLGVTVVRF